MNRATKPLGGKSYGSICHLPGSRLGPGDHKINPGQARILTQQTRDGSDLVIVTEKLDGSNVAVARVNGELIPIIRAGYPAVASHYEQHRLFATWVLQHLDKFEFLNEGERLCGEWLAQAHGTRYAVTDQPFVAFDLIRGDKRVRYKEFDTRVRLPKAFVLHWGHSACSIAAAMRELGLYGHHGATEVAEGAVWRVERDGEVDFLAKYVRPEKRAGCYLPIVTGQDPIWNWRPS